MTQALALDLARRIRTHMLSYGVPEVSIELRVGRSSPLTASDWYCPEFRLNFEHHTVSRYSPSNLTPVLNLVKVGRSDVPGPLANGYLGYDLCYRIITCGLANHPGAGGPYKMQRGGYVIPQDSMRPYGWGTENEGGMEESDWTRILTNPRNGKKMSMMECMGRVDAALNSFPDWPRGEFWIADQCEHKDPWAPTRKIDRRYRTRSQWQANARLYTPSTPTPPKDWFEMADEETLKQAIREVFLEPLAPSAWTADKKVSPWSVMSSGQFYAIQGGFNGVYPPNTYRPERAGSPTYARGMFLELAATKSAVEALSAAVASDQDLDLDAVAALLEEHRQKVYAEIPNLITDSVTVEGDLNVVPKDPSQ